MAAAALPIALLLGAFADAVGGLLATRSARGAFAPLVGAWRDLGALASGGAPLSPPRLAGLAASLTGSALAAAGLIGAGAGSIALLAGALILAAAAAPLAAGSSVRTRAWLLERAAVELAFLVALGAGFLRWRALDIDAVRGAHQVLGTGFEVGPAAPAVGLGLVAVVMVLTGAARASLDRRPPEGVAGDGAVAALARWALLGASALAVSMPLASRDLENGAGAPLLVWVPAVLGAAALAGVAALLLDRLPAPHRRAVVAAAAALAVVAGVLAVLR